MQEPLLIVRDQVERVLHLLIPLYSEIISSMKLSNEDGSFNTQLQLTLENLKIRSWSSVYEDPANEAKIAWLMMETPSEINAMTAELACMSGAAQSTWVQNFFSEAISSFDDFFVEDSFSQEHFDALPEAEKQQFINKLQLFWTFFLPSVFNLFSKIVHGKSLFQLVEEAKLGNFQSFLDAIQIDKSIITTIPYFVEVNHRAADECDLKTQRLIATYRNKPIFQGNIRYLPLWLVFSILDDMMLLEEYEKNLDTFAQLCQNLRVYGPPPEEDVVDLEAFQGRLKDYKQHRRHLIERSMAVRLVKDETSLNFQP